MSNNVQGVSRIKQPDGMEDDALVRDIGGNEWVIPESTYRERGYGPNFDELPWR